MKELFDKFDNDGYVCVEDISDSNFLLTELRFEYGENNVWLLVIDNKDYLYNESRFVYREDFDFIRKTIRRRELVKNRVKVIDSIL